MQRDLAQAPESRLVPIVAHVGSSTDSDPVQAGTTAVGDALAGLGNRKPVAVMLFATAGYEQDILARAAKHAAGDDVIVIGCSGEGVITRRGSDEGAHCVAAVAFGGDGLRAEPVLIEGLAVDSADAGARLAKTLAARNVPDDGVLFLFPDGLTVNSSRLLDSLEASLPPKTTIIGGTSGELMAMEQTFQYMDGKSHSDAVAALHLSGPFDVVTAVSHGCEPFGIDLTVTEAEGNEVISIDNKPALQAFLAYFDDGTDDLRAADIVHLCLGESLEGDDAYGRHIIRTPLGINKERGSLHFPAEMPAGTKIRMMRRDSERIASSARAVAAQVATGAGSHTPSVVFQFDCAGRGRIMFGDETDRYAVQPLQEAFPAGTPWIGFHTYGEIAPVAGRTRFHNYTVALCALYPKIR